MKPSESYMSLMKVARMCATICGADVINPNFQFNIITKLSLFLVTVYFIFSIFTVISVFEGDFGIFLQSFTMIGSAVQGLSKFFTGVLSFRKVAATNIYLTNIYIQYEQKGEQYILVLNRTVSFVSKLLKVIAAIYVVLFSCMLLSPVVILLITGRRYLTIQFYVPFLDVDTDVGYFSTISFQSLCLILSGFGNYAGDLVLLIYNSHVILFVDILKLKISELNGNASKCVETEETKYLLNDIIDWHQQYSSFTELCNDLFYWIIFTQITSSALSMVLAIFIILTGDWPGSYAFMALQTCSLFSYCFVGTLVEITFDKFRDEIYFINWYELSVSQRKCILLILMKSQNPRLVMVGGVMDLSMSTGLQITKSVYSIMTMIVNFLE